MIEVKRKEKETVGGLLRRFQKSVQAAGIVMTARSHRFFDSPPTKRARRLNALRRVERVKEIKKLKKLGKWKDEERRTK